MSVQAITWALGCKTAKSSDKFVLLVLANYADQDGFCWPHVGTIAELTVLSVRAIRRCLARLDGAFITVEKRRGTFGQQASSHYFLDLNSEIIFQTDVVSPSVQSELVAVAGCHDVTLYNDDTSNIYVNNTLVQNDALIVENDALFDVWWALYPRKQDKKKALVAWTKQGCEKNAESLIDTLRNQIANDAQYSGDQQYIPLPSSYLNKGKFNDEIVIRSRTEPRETSAEAAERELAEWETKSDDGAPMAGDDASVSDICVHVWSDAEPDVE